MTDSVELNAPDIDVSEIELDASELSSAAPLGASGQPLPAAEKKPTATSTQTGPKKTIAPSDRSVSMLRIAGVACVAVGLAAASFYYMYSPSKGPAQQSTIAWPRLASIGPSDDPQAASEQPQPPVRVKNPFDASEVFEFPAGTSKVEAREAVAQMLMARARERQALIAVDHSRNSHSAGR